MALEKLFERRGKEIIPKDVCWQILPIKSAFEKWPEEINKLCSYWHFLYSMNKEDNPYAEVDLDLRSDQIVSDIGLEADAEDPIMKRALNCVEEKYITTFYTIYKGFKASMDRIGKSLLTTPIDFSARDGNVANILRIVKDYGSLRDSFKSAYRDFEEETKGRTRGGGRLGIDENDPDEDDEL